MSFILLFLMVSNLVFGEISGVISKSLPVLSTKTVLCKMAVNREFQLSTKPKTVNDTSDLTVDRVDELGRQQVLHVWFIIVSVDTKGSTNGIKPVEIHISCLLST